MNNRRTRRFKERRPMFPFGQLMLPVIGVVAIGLLVIGIKLFFFSGPGTPVIVAIPENITENAISAQSISPQEQVKLPEDGASTVQPIATTTKIEPVQQTGKVEPVLAVPVTQEAQAAPRIVPSQEKTPVINTEKKSADSLSVHQSGTKPEPREQGSKSGWGVQIGAFSAKKSADSVLSKVIKQGFDGELNQAEINGKVFYRVRVPSGNSRESATAMAQRLKDKNYPTLIVTLDQ